LEDIFEAEDDDAPAVAIAKAHGSVIIAQSGFDGAEDCFIPSEAPSRFDYISEAVINAEFCTHGKDLKIMTISDAVRFTQDDSNDSAEIAAVKAVL
jgi:hypothetical protein